MASGSAGIPFDPFLHAVNMRGNLPKSVAGSNQVTIEQLREISLAQSKLVRKAARLTADMQNNLIQVECLIAARTVANQSVRAHDETSGETEPPLPLHYGDPELYRWDPAQWKFYCRVCRSYADDGHVTSARHKMRAEYKNVYLHDDGCGLPASTDVAARGATSDRHGHRRS